MRNGKKIVWIIDGALSNQLHKNARLKPALELEKMGWDVTIITSGIHENNVLGELKFYRVAWPKIYLLGAVVYYLRVIKLMVFGNIDADIILFQMDSLSVFLVLIDFLKALTNHKKSVTVVDYRSIPMDTLSLKGKFRNIIFKFGVFATKRLNVKVTAITDEIVRFLDIKDTQLLGIWPSGADLEDFEACAAKRTVPIDNEPLKLIYLGAMRKERNLISVIQAAIIAKNSGVNLTLELIGDGAQRNELVQLVKNKHDDYIFIKGPVPYEKVPDVLSQRHIGILPFPDVDKMRVSSAIKMFEYMASGLPIIATEIIAHKNVFGKSDFVFWCSEHPESMADAILRIDDERQKLEELSLKAIDWSKNWTWESSAKKLSAALERVI